MNGNGTDDDLLLIRTDLITGQTGNMGVLNDLSRPAIATESDGVSGGGAFLFDERILGSDQNGDLDTIDFAVRYFTFP